MLTDETLTAFIATAQPEHARQFYESTLGLRFVSDSEFALVFDAKGVELRIQKVERVSPPVATVLGWRVGDITQTVTERATRGVVFERYPHLEQNDLGIWTSPGGAQVAWFKDPDGNMLSVSEH